MFDPITDEEAVLVTRMLKAGWSRAAVTKRLHWPASRINRIYETRSPVIWNSVEPWDEAAPPYRHGQERLCIGPHHVPAPRALAGRRTGQQSIFAAA